MVFYGVLEEFWSEVVFGFCCEEVSVDVDAHDLRESCSSRESLDEEAFSAPQVEYSANLMLL